MVCSACLAAASGPGQIADRLGVLVGDMDDRQIARTKKVSQFGGIAAVGLDPASLLGRDQRGSDHGDAPTGGKELTARPNPVGPAS